nr:SIS domain-containing protein [Pseudonocardia acidicola]
MARPSLSVLRVIRLLPSTPGAARRRRTRSSDASCRIVTRSPPPLRRDSQRGGSAFHREYPLPPACRNANANGKAHGAEVRRWRSPPARDEDLEDAPAGAGSGRHVRPRPAAGRILGRRDDEYAAFLLRDGDGSALGALPAAGDALVARSEDVRALAARYQFASRLVVTGRGYAYPTAREGALKLMETCYLSAQAFSGADLLHGPLAMVTSQVPVLAVAPDGVGGQSMGEVLQRLHAVGAHVLTIGGAQAIAASSAGLQLPAGIDEAVSPLLEILPLQQLALHLAITRGENPDIPRGLSKITKTL